MKNNTITNVPAGVPYEVFQSQRQSDSTYTIPEGGKGFSFDESSLPNGNYTLTLYFAEIGNTITGSGQRQFNIFVNGAQVATDFDIYAAAGGKNIAVAESYPVTVTGGQFSVDCQDVVGKSLLAALALGPPASFAADAPAPDYAEDVIPMDDAGTGGAGPSDGISADLASGVEENHPGPDLTVYNPVGPTAVYERMYRSSRALSGTTGYGSPGLSSGWMDDYDYQVTKNANNYTLTYPNGSTETWSGTTGSLAVPTGAPYLASAPNTSTLTMTFKDRSVYTFTLDSGTTTYRLTGIANIAQHALTIARDSSHRLLTVKNDASPVATLLSFTYPSATKMTVTDAYGRFVNLTFGTLGASAILTSVSQIASSGMTPASSGMTPASSGMTPASSGMTPASSGMTPASSGMTPASSGMTPASSGMTPAALWNYGYTAISAANNLPFLNTVQTPSPANPSQYPAATVTPNANGTVYQITDGRTGSMQGFRILTPGLGKTVVTTGQNPSAPVTNLTAAQLYGTMNESTGMVDAANNASSVIYGDTAHNPYQPTQVTNRDDEITTFAYDQNKAANAPYAGNLTTLTDNYGVTTTMTYYPSDFALGELQKVQQSSTEGGSTVTHTPTTYAYYSSGYLDDFLETATTPDPNAVNGTSPSIDTHYTYDTTATAKGLGNVTDVKTPGPNSTSGTLSTYTDTAYAYASTPALGEPTSITVTGVNPASYVPLGGSAAQATVSQTETYAYNTGGVNTGTLSSMTDASGYKTSYYYNVADQLIGTQYPVTTGSSGAYMAYAYEYPGGPLASETLYAEGVVTNAPTIPNGATAFEQATYAYDAEGNLAQKRGSVYPVDYAYDGIDRVTAMTEYSSLSGSVKEITNYAYDPVGRLSDTYYPGWTMMNDPYDHWKYGYDADDNLTGRTDGAGTVTAYARNPRLHALVDTVTYTPGSKITVNGGTSYDYDPFERRMSMTDDSGSKSYTYSDINLPLSVTTGFTGGPQDQQISYAYNPDGTRTTMTPPLAPLSGKSFAYAYDGLSRLVQVTAPFADDYDYSPTAARTIDYAYEAGASANASGNDWLTAMESGVLTAPFTLSGETGTAYDQLTLYYYDARGFLTALQNGEQGDLVSQFDADGNGNPMPYDTAGNRLGFTETLPGTAEYNGTDAARTVSYAYDTLGRNQLTGETSSITSAPGIPDADYNYGYAYDDAGNPTTWKSTMGDFGFDADNQVTGVSGLAAPAYDGSGNPTTFSTPPPATPSGFGAQGYNGATFQFDPENRLRTINATAFTAQYDGDGMRAQKTTSADGTVYFLYDGGTLLEEQTFSGGSPALQSLYLVGADGLRSRYFADSQGDRNTYAYSFDPQGSLCQVQLTLNYDAGGNFAENTLCYDGWGGLLGDDRVPTGYEASPFDSVGFGGQSGYYQDIETGLYELGARYYDAGKGRFVNRDPIGYGGNEMHTTFMSTTTTTTASTTRAAGKPACGLFTIVCGLVGYGFVERIF